MWRQHSYRDQQHRGILYLVPTPIGNLEDMTFRAVRILKEADMIAAEDTRNTKKLCRHFEIETPLVSYHEHNKEKSGASLIAELESGKTVALVSDAGMPAISDPGYELVGASVERRLPVVPLPGASAGLSALIASGLSAQQFFFYGFLPRAKKEKKQELERVKAVSATLIFYEAPHRIRETLAFMAEPFGNRRVCIARELTKTFEEWVRGSLDEVGEWMASQEPKGEFCLVVEGALEEEKEKPWWSGLTKEEHVRHYVDIRQMPSKEAIKLTAKERSVPKQEVYMAYHTGRGNER